MVAMQERCSDANEWKAVAYAAARDPSFPIIAGLRQLARLGAFGLPCAEPPARLVEIVTELRAVDDGQRFALHHELRAAELIRLVKQLVLLNGVLDESQQG